MSQQSNKFNTSAQNNFKIYTSDESVSPLGIPEGEPMTPQDMSGLQPFLPPDLVALFTSQNTKNLRDVFEEKFNPYHDPGTGRFTSGTGVTSHLASLIAQKGGFTYQPVSGVSPKKGLALSIYPEHSKIIDVANLKAQDLRKYIDDNKTILQDKTNFLGAWHDTDSGRVFLDISKIVTSHEEARKLSEQYGQRAYFDLSTFNTIDVVPEALAHKGLVASWTELATMTKKQKSNSNNKPDLTHIPTDATDAQLEEIVKKIKQKQAQADAQKGKHQ